MKNLLKLTLLSLVLVTMANVASAQETPANITFPIPELGNCTDKQSCHLYCEDVDHITACAQFAADHGIISQEKANKAKEFKDALIGGGPGGCKDQNSCAAYCEDITHADTCLAFAEKHNLIPPQELQQAKKVAQVLREGGQTPGACTSKATCEAYCQDTNHLDECLAFAQKANLMTPEQLSEAQKVIPLMKRGETPGKCDSKESCMAYCKDTSHFDECISFAEKANLVSKEDAAIARKSGGVGPGGCTSKESCEAFCNAPENAKTCFSFAKEKGILSPDKIKEIEDGMGRLRTGLKQMPPEMAGCLTDALGADAVSQIEAGTLTPGPDIGTKVQACAQSFAPKLKEKMTSVFGMATPETLACLETVMGQSRLEEIKGGAVPSPSEGDQMKKCFESMRTEGMKKAQEGLSQMPPEMRSCLESKLGADALAKIQTGDTEALGPETGQAFKECAGGVQNSAATTIRQKMGTLPPGVRECVAGELGEDFEQNLAAGELDPAKMQGTVSKCMKAVIMKQTQGVPGGIPVMGPPQGIEEGKVPTGIPSGIPKGVFPTTVAPSNIPKGVLPAGIPSGIPEGVPDVSTMGVPSGIPKGVLPTGVPSVPGLPAGF